MVEGATIIVTGPTALRAIRCERRRHARLTWRPLGKVEQRHALASCVPNRGALDLDGLAVHGILPDEADGRVHVLIGPESARRNKGPIRCHSLSRNPAAGSIHMIGPGVCCASPTLALLQLGPEATFPEALMQAMELCGHYCLPESEEMARNPFSDSARIGYYPAEPATTARELRRFARHASGLRGIDTLRQLSRHVLDGSASPMESLAAAMFHLPFRYGGFAIREMLLNKEVIFSEGATRASDMRHAYCDIYVPRAKTTLEYNGSPHDTHAARIHDEKRVAGLAAMGIDVIPLNDAQLRNPDALESIARLLYRRSGKAYQCRVRTHTTKRDALLNDLRRASGLSSV